jgi:serine/threonine-protein kinase RsbW
VSNRNPVVRLEFTSAIEVLDFVQIVSDYVARGVGLDEEAVHWVGVSVRESVINAIRHGNRGDVSKHVFVEFATGVSDNDRPALSISVRDEGEGFDPAALPNPLAPENLLKSNGRGIFLIRSFMDDVQLRRTPGGGMEIRMMKCGTPARPVKD